MQALGRESGFVRGRPVQFSVDGQVVTSYEGETVAAVLIAEGRRTFRRTARRGEPRGLFCGMGVCFDCLVTVDGVPNQRACQTPVCDGMCVQFQHGEGMWQAPR